MNLFQNYTGLLIDILMAVQEELKFSYTLIPSTDGIYGSLDRISGQWTGQIGQLQRKEIDFSIMDLTILLNRAMVWFFAHFIFKPSNSDVARRMKQFKE